MPIELGIILPSASAEDGDTIDDELETRAHIESAITALQNAIATHGQRSLHPVEVMMVQDVLAENRHLRCKSCLHWIQKLTHKILDAVPPT